MKSDFLIAVTQLASERQLPREAVISAIEAALASAYKKDSVLAGQEVSVSLNPANGELKLFTHKIAVQAVEDSNREISLTDAKKIEKSAKLGEIIAVESDIQTTGRIAAQTAKQVVLQRLREAERELVYEEYAEKEGDIVTGTIQRIDSRQLTLDLGRTEAILPLSEQVMTERYRVGQKLKVNVSEVRRSVRGPEIVVSRSSKDLLRRLFEMEVPEIFNGIVEIKAVAREAGARSKVAVYSRQVGVDPVGSCVGLRGIRIQNIVNELQGEKIDVVQWNADLEIFLANALSPCPVTRVELDANDGTAVVVVPDRQLSLAIGREGQNARLCAKLSGLMVNIKSATEAEESRILRSDDSEDQSADGADISEITLAEEDLYTPALVQVQASETVAGIADSSIVLDDTISIEERLAEEAIIIDADVEGSVKEIAIGSDLSEVSETVWNVAQSVEQPQRIRFAEDIMGSKAATAPETRKRGRQSKGPRGGVEDVSPRSTRRSRREDYSIEDESDQDDDMNV